MSQNEQGMVYAFRLSGSRMRQSAHQLRRQGQTLDAVSLVRRAAEQDDTPAAWLALATELRALGNWEAAVPLLARVLSRDAHHPGVWIEMARCLQALGHPDAALDCVYHQLQEDPWSKEGDAARSLLAQLDTIHPEGEPRRTQRLIHRGLTAWQSGDRALGERRIRRALRLVAEKERLLVTAAMMCMMEMDFDGALRYLPRALRRNPEDPRTLTALSTLVHQRGQRRLARGLLKKAGQHADTVMAEDGFLTTAWAQDAWDELNEFLAVRMKQQPWRIPLMSAKATMCCELADQPGAQQLWKDILALDPDDRMAAAMLSVQQDPQGLQLCVPGMLPRTERQRQLTELKMAAESRPAEELLRSGSRSLRLIDWFLCGNYAEERRYAMALLETCPAAVPYLKELLCRPFLRFETRQWALIRLAEMGCRDEMLIMTGGHYSFIACQKVDEEKLQRPWRRFLPLLLEETRRYRRSNEIAEFAAEVWSCLPMQEKQEAAGAQRYAWCKAMEILFLRAMGEEAQAAAVAMNAALSARKISRVLRRISRYTMNEMVDE